MRGNHGEVLAHYNDCRHQVREAQCCAAEKEKVKNAEYIGFVQFHFIRTRVLLLKINWFLYSSILYLYSKRLKTIE